MAAGILLPGEEHLPPGPHRALLEALHTLYEGAGKPGLRRIAAGVTHGEYRDTISHEKVGALLRGDGLPGWLKVEGVVRQLAIWHNPRHDPDQEAARFTALWLAADRARRVCESGPAASAVQDAPLETNAAGTAVAATAAGSAPPQPSVGDRLSSVVRGRDGIIHMLSGLLDAQPLAGRPQVLVGDAGIGKSTIACSVAGMVRDGGPQRRTWWVCAADEERLSRDLTDLARDLGVGEAHWSRLGTRPVADLSTVADRVWEMLQQEQPGWLLVIDNADDPGLLGPQDGTGWIRQSARGLVLITTRDSSRASWPGADVIGVGPLPPPAAAQVLVDLAPAAGDHASAQALAHRLGYVPLALQLAGMYLRQGFASGRTFDEYRHELAHTATREVPLDGLVRAGYPQARPLLWLLARYAPSSLILEEIIIGGAPPAWSSRRPGS